MQYKLHIRRAHSKKTAVYWFVLVDVSWTLIVVTHSDSLAKAAAIQKQCW